MALSPVPGGSTVEAVLDQLQAEVTAGSWQVGDRIPGELDLASQLGVSRPAVREAIRALSHVGVLEVRRGDGTYVRSSADPRPLLRRIERASVRDVFEVQLAYDVQAARLAARRRTDADVKRLQDLLAGRAAASDAAEFGEADSRFHMAVVEVTRNPVLIEGCRYYLRKLSDSLSAAKQDCEIPISSQEAHQAVVDAIAAGDAEAAGRAAAAIVEPTLAVLEELVKGTVEGGADR